MTKKHWKLFFWKEKRFFFFNETVLGFFWFMIHSLYDWLPASHTNFLEDRSKDWQDKIKKEEKSEKAKIIPGKQPSFFQLTFAQHHSLLLPLLSLCSFRLLPDYRSTVDLFLTVEVSCGLDTHTKIYIHSLFLITTSRPNICRTLPSLPNCNDDLWFELPRDRWSLAVASWKYVVPMPLIFGWKYHAPEWWLTLMFKISVEMPKCHLHFLRIVPIVEVYCLPFPTSSNLLSFFALLSFPFPFHQPGSNRSLPLQSSNISCCVCRHQKGGA